DWSSDVCSSDLTFGAATEEMADVFVLGCDHYVSEELRTVTTRNILGALNFPYPHTRHPIRKIQVKFLQRFAQHRISPGTHHSVRAGCTDAKVSLLAGLDRVNEMLCSIRNGSVEKWNT